MGGNLAREEGGRGGAAPGLGFPKNPARVVCLVLSCISMVSQGIAQKVKEAKRRYMSELRGKDGK